MTTSLPPIHRRLALAAAIVLLATTPGSTVAQDAAAPRGDVTVYTSVTEDTVEAVRAALAAAAPDLHVEVFRAPTGELDARIASERRGGGGLGADVLWLSDPLSMQQYQADGLLAPLAGAAVEAVPEAYRDETFVGTRLLNLVLVAPADAEHVPGSWSDLADPALAGRVALPDPRFAGTAFAALGYFATAEGLGMDYYRTLKEAGAVQVQSPVDTLTGVAEGIYDTGITLDKLARATIEAGAPIQLIWPEPGAIAVFSPAAVVAESDDPVGAQAFVEFLVGPAGQAAIASTGWQPVRDDIEWPGAGPVVAPDWGELYGSQERLLAEYDAIFGD